MTGTAHAAGTAHTADTADGGYRYWSFWTQKDHGADTWSYATEGPATHRPDDGDTLGFRFALSEDSKNAKKPRGTTKFAATCAGTPKKAGTKRIALRLDFGTRTDAPKTGSGKREAPPEPRTACARVNEDASAGEALASVAKPLRYSSDSLLCAIDGYPARGCGEQVADNGDGGKQQDSDSAAKDSGDNGDGGDGGTMSSGLGVTAGIAAVAVLGAAALWQARRRKQ
ncbi:SCO2322 family protein [Streptomyces iconiensis]|uniref:SCO2322 family protein n=1 Tax=Streptomyces iconiensis TaxID=1384038 RepID=A0ABT6ZP87_9ACTN|nr:SCO2322 family protein [Streptomyces iconiensis]MDJ1130677.1 SCO2322 family protein [Streptomyces iconiensis]